MRRRNLFGFLGALGALALVGRATPIRFVEFSAPGQPPAINWIEGHKRERFVWMHSQSDMPIPSQQVTQGWAMLKLSRIGMYLSDVPREGFEPITYWIRADHSAQEITA